jgi:hypothetical protein
MRRTGAGTVAWLADLPAVDERPLPARPRRHSTPLHSTVHTASARSVLFFSFVHVGLELARTPGLEIRVSQGLDGLDGVVIN